MVGRDTSIGLLPDGAELSRQRLMFAQVLGTRKSINVFQSRMEKKVVQFVRRLLDNSGSELDVYHLAHWCELQSFPQLCSLVILTNSSGTQVDKWHNSGYHIQL